MTATNRCYYCNAAVGASDLSCAACNQPQLLQERYRLVGVLGRGGFGIVYEAVDTRMGRRCAVKTVSAATLTEQRQNETEANILSQYAAQIPFIPNIYDIWSDRSQLFMVMEYIEGATLDEIARQPWQADRVEEFLRLMLANLRRLHEVGIVHRDLKPKNIKYTPDGHYVLLDFGIAKQGEVTLSGARAASLNYAPPEQIAHEHTDVRADLYGLAATAYHLLTGQPPSRADMRLTHGAPLIPPSQLVSGVPLALDVTLLQMLRLSPAERPASAQAALELLNRQPELPQPRGPSMPTVTPAQPRAYAAQQPARAAAPPVQPQQRQQQPAALSAALEDDVRRPAGPPARRARRPWWVAAALPLLALLIAAIWALPKNTGVTPGTTETSGLSSTPATAEQQGPGPDEPAPQETPPPQEIYITNLAEVTASSVLTEEIKGEMYIHAAENVLDDDPSDSWVEAVDGAGLGETLTFKFARPVVITALEIDVGYDDDDDSFYDNNRVRAFRLAVEGQQDSQRYQLEDERGLQRVTLRPLVAQSLTLVIEEVYQGRKYDDTAISIVKLRGYELNG